MTGDPYPLAAARTLRAREEDEATTALARANEGLAAAERALRAAQDAVSAHRTETEDTLLAERRRDESPRTVADARLTHAWTARRKEELRKLAANVDVARRAVDEARAVVEAARAALAAARAEREAVEKHHARWLDERRKVKESRDEAEIEDGLAGRRR